MVNELKYCLCCGSDNLSEVIDLGDQSPANNYNIKKEYPLRLNLCNICSHLQLSHSVDPKILFNDYPYYSGVSSTMLEYYKSFASMAVKYNEPKNVLEIACNDGSQLNEFKNLGLKTYCIEPSRVHAKDIEDNGHYLNTAFFPSGFDMTFDIIVAQNVFAHTPDPLGFLNGCYKRMHKNSYLFIQNSQINMIMNGQFDTIYHEHISFFNIGSMKMILSRAGMELIETILVPKIHGDSMVYVIKKKEIDLTTYGDFVNKSNTIINDFKDAIERHRKYGYTIVIYGAAAKMINLLRQANVKPDYIVDDTPAKIGKEIPGLGVITNKLPEGKLLIVPVWNFYDEIKDKIGDHKVLRYLK